VSTDTYDLEKPPPNKDFLDCYINLLVSEAKRGSRDGVEYFMPYLKKLSRCHHRKYQRMLMLVDDPDSIERGFNGCKMETLDVLIRDGEYRTDVTYQAWINSEQVTIVVDDRKDGTWLAHDADKPGRKFKIKGMNRFRCLTSTADRAEDIRQETTTQEDE